MPKANPLPPTRIAPANLAAVAGARSGFERPFKRAGFRRAPDIAERFPK
jgi:hypothetical protein